MVVFCGDCVLIWCLGVLCGCLLGGLQRGCCVGVDC